MFLNATSDYVNELFTHCFSQSKMNINCIDAFKRNMFSLKKELKLVNVVRKS